MSYMVTSFPLGIQSVTWLAVKLKKINVIGYIFQKSCYISHGNHCLHTCFMRKTVPLNAIKALPGKGYKRSIFFCSRQNFLFRSIFAQLFTLRFSKKAFSHTVYA